MAMSDPVLVPTIVDASGTFNAAVFLISLPVRNHNHSIPCGGSHVHDSAIGASCDGVRTRGQSVVDRHQSLTDTSR